MAVERINRISEEVKRELSDIIMNDLKDPRITGMISIVNLKVTRDLRYAKVYISIYGSDEDKKNAIDGLRNAAGFLRKEIGRRVQLRYTPELIFEMDDSIEQGIYISNLIEKLNKE